MTTKKLRNMHSNNWKQQQTIVRPVHRTIFFGPGATDKARYTQTNLTSVVFDSLKIFASDMENRRISTF